MADLVVSMGIEDRGVRRGLQTVESMVHRSQQNMGRRGLFGDDSGILRTEKGLNKIAGSMTGLPLKLGALGAAFYAFKNGAEYIAEFEQYLPKAERGIGQLADSMQRFKESWALDMRAGLDGTGKVGGGLLDILSTAREYYTDYVAVVMKLAGGGGAELGAGDTPWAYREEAKREMESLKAQRQKEQSLVREKQLNADIAALKEDQHAADIARAEAARAAASIELGRKVRDEGWGKDEKSMKMLAEERRGIRARYDAAVAKADREKKTRDDEAAEKQAQDERKRLEERNKAKEKAAEDSLRIEDNLVRAKEVGAVTAEEKLAAKKDRISLETEERLQGYAQRLREGSLDKPGYAALRASELGLEDSQYKAVEGEYAKARADAEQAAAQKREGAMIDAEELRAQVAVAKARTDEEKKVAKELELQAKFRRDEATLRSQGLDPDVERMLLEERRNLLDAELGAAELGAAGRDRGRRDDYARPGVDLSSAGAVASQGQAFAYSIPGKIDRTNALLQLANQTLREIKQGQGDGARFA